MERFHTSQVFFLLTFFRIFLKFKNFEIFNNNISLESDNMIIFPGAVLLSLSSIDYINLNSSKRMHHKLNFNSKNNEIFILIKFFLYTVPF